MYLFDETITLIPTAIALTLASSAAFGAFTNAYAGARHCGVAFEASTSYPPLPPPTGADIESEAGALVHLLVGRAVIELDDCLYEVDRPLWVDLAAFDQLELLFELEGQDEGSEQAEGLFVSEGATGGYELLRAEDSQLSYTLDAAALGGPLSFELALPGQEAPVSPVIRVEPTSGTPEPK